MGLFSSIKKIGKSIAGGVSSGWSALKKVAKPVAEVAKPLMGAVAPFVPLASSALSYFGGKERNEEQIKQADSANAQSLEMQQRQFDFQERMSNSAYQRSMADMEQAGLNPILAVGNGMQASTPMGSSGAGQQAQIQDVLTPAVQSMLNSAQTVSNVQLQETTGTKQSAETEVLHQKKMEIAEYIQNLATSRRLTENQIDKISREVIKTNQEIEQTIAKTHAVNINNITAEMKMEFIRENPWIIKADAISKAIGLGADDILDIFNVGIFKILKRK